MTEQEIRALVRDVIAGHGAPRTPVASAYPVAALRLHASHSVFMVPEGADGDGVCIIEPAVRCNHCQYCKSLGH